MFSKPILKQTLKANYKLWLVFTLIMCALSAVIIAVFDQQMISSMLDMLQDTALSDMIDSEMTGMTSVLGMLSQSFYSMQGIIMMLIFVIMTANSLIASQVDRGSMAYLLSTPIKRSKVVRTQAMYLITSIFSMFLVLTIVGLSTVQIFHGGIIGTNYTEDVKAAAEVLDLDEDKVNDDLNLILDNEDALEAGAEARNIDEDVYSAYLTLKISENAYGAAAEILDVDAETVSEDPSLIKDNDKALSAAAEIMGMDGAAYSVYLDVVIAQQETNSELSEEMQNNLLTGLTEAADIVDMEVTDLASDMSVLKSNDEAFEAVVNASGIPGESITALINQQLASNELALDDGIEFNVKDYLMLNLGAFLLMFATSSISFLFSCIFNLSKNSLALGAGIPIAFFIFQIMSQVGDSLEGFKYLSLNTLYDTNAIISEGSFSVQFTVLAVIGVVLYAVGMRWFKEKDLPL